MTTSTYGNKQLAGTSTSDKIGLVTDQKLKESSDKINVVLTKRETKIILIAVENFFKGLDGAIMAIKHYELVEEFEKIENKKFDIQLICK